MESNQMKNKRLALRLLANDCEIKTHYIEGKKTCAVGCLALASGVKRARLLDHNSIPITWLPMGDIRNAIMDKFDLTAANLRAIQNANDSYSNVEDRRNAVLAVVKAII